MKPDGGRQVLCADCEGELPVKPKEDRQSDAHARDVGLIVIWEFMLLVFTLKDSSVPTLTLVGSKKIFPNL